MVENGELIERALVRDFAGVERWRLRKYHGARDSFGAAGGLRGESFEQVLEAREDGLVRENFMRRRIGPEAGTKRATCEQVGKNHHADIVAVMTGDDDVAHERRKVAEDSGAERADAHPCSGGEFEIFGEAAIEEEAFVDVVWVNESERVTEFVEAIVVEGFFRQGRLAPVSRRDIWPADAGFKFFVVRHKLCFDAGNGDADDSSAIRVPGGLDGHGRGFGGA